MMMQVSHQIQAHHKTYVTPWSKCNGIWPMVNPNPTNDATLAVQQVADVIASFFSLRINKSLLGWNWEPPKPVPAKSKKIRIQIRIQNYCHRASPIPPRDPPTPTKITTKTQNNTTTKLYDTTTHFFTTGAHGKGLEKQIRKPPATEVEKSNHTSERDGGAEDRDLVAPPLI